jgi:hypothetical protein
LLCGNLIDHAAGAVVRAAQLGGAVNVAAAVYRQAALWPFSLVTAGKVMEAGIFFGD